MSRILIVEDEPILRKNIVDRLRAEGHELYDTATAESAEQLAALLSPELVITDLRLPGIDGIELLRRVRRSSPRTLVVIMTAHGTQASALDAVRAGAYDYLTKPVELRELVLLVQRTLQHARLRDRLQCAKRSQLDDAGLERLVGASPAARELKQQIAGLASSSALASRHPPPILLSGETGVGKSLVARILHREGRRREMPLVVIACGKVTDERFNAEYLGLNAGEKPRGGPADSGERGETRGLIELASDGTVFLDEIAALPPAAQVRLAQLIEHRSIQTGDGRIGRPIDVQFIAATSRDLARLAADGKFSADLYHRLRAIEMSIPPLRQRVDDIAPLAQHFLETMCQRRGIDVPRLSEDAIQAMTAYPWPGNARELASTIERSLHRCDGRWLTARDLGLEPKSANPASGRAGDRIVSIDVNLDAGDSTLENLNGRIVRAVLERLNQDVDAAARLLNILPEEVRYHAGRDVTTP